MSLVSDVERLGLDADEDFSANVRAWLSEPGSEHFLHLRNADDLFERLCSFARCLVELADDPHCVSRRADPATLVPLRRGMNLLITGVKGVGKTSLVTSIIKYLALHHNSVIAIHHNLEVDGITLPSELLLNALQQAGIDIGADPKTPLRINKIVDAAREQNVRFFIFLDEIQFCYNCKSDLSTDDARLGLRALQEMLILGKETMDVVTILSGSSKQTLRLAHHQDLQEIGMEDIQCNFPNLNYSVFRAYQLQPLRSKDDFSLVFPSKSVEALAAMFYTSGGVGREFDGVGRPIRRSLDPHTRELLAAILFRGQLLIDDLESAGVKVNQAAADRLKSDPWNLPSISRHEAQNILARYMDDTKARAHLLLLQDDGMLYEMEPSGNLTVLIPSHAVEYAKQIAHYGSQQSSSVSFAFQMTLGGIAGSLGALLEAPILMTAIKAATLPNHTDRLKFAGGRISFAGGSVTVQRADSKSDITDGSAFPEEELFQLTRDFGADGFWLQHDKDQYVVHLVQIKTGALNKKITLGGVGSVEPRHRNGNAVAKFDKKAETLLGICRRLAHEAWPDLKQGLGCLGKRLVLGSMTLLTTKRVDAPDMEQINSRTVRGVAPNFFDVDGQPVYLTIVNKLDNLIPSNVRGMFKRLE